MDPRPLKQFVRKEELVPKVRLGVDAGRIREITEHALESIDELLQHPDYKGSKDRFRESLTRILDSGLIAQAEVSIPLGNSVMNDLSVIINLMKKKVWVRSARFPTKRAMLNSILKAMK